MKNREARASTQAALIVGLARTLDLMGRFGGCDWSRDGWLTDGRALRSDWETVGSDLRHAFRRAPDALPAETKGQLPLFPTRDPR